MQISRYQPPSGYRTNFCFFIIAKYVRNKTDIFILIINVFDSFRGIDWFDIISNTDDNIIVILILSYAHYVMQYPL